MFNLGYCKCEYESQDLGVCEMLTFPRPSVDLKTGKEILSFMVHWKHSKKRSFWKESKATSHHHFPPSPLRPSVGIDWQGFQFQAPQSCQHKASTASCLPHGKHRHISSLDCKHYLAVVTPLLFPKPLLLWDSSLNVLNLTREQLSQRILSLG